MDSAERLEKVRHFLFAEEKVLAEAAAAGRPGLTLALRRSQILSALLILLWRDAGGESTGQGLVLGAVGGFGREEMSPFSDIDLVFIREGLADPVAEGVVKKMLYVLWDLGMKVGHACRTIQETLDRAETEPLIKTALLDARYLAGSPNLWTKFLHEFRNRSVARGVEKYLGWRLENQSARHRKEGGTVFMQEPNLKTGVGGLRDFHNLRWVGRVSGKGANLSELVSQNWLGQGEAEQVEKAFAFLMTLRERLHTVQGGPGDVLTLRLQGELAILLQYPQPNILRQSEALMREVYQQMRTIHFIANATSQRICQEHLGRPRGFWSFFSGWQGARRAADGFVLNGAELSAETPQVFAEDPTRVIRVFRILQDQGSVPSAALAALLRSQSEIWDEAIVRKKEVQETFLHILKQKGKVARIVRLMHETGILGRMLPEFAPLTCLVQHEFFHRYTADEHTLICLEQIDAMLGSQEMDLRKYGDLLAQVTAPEILSLAILLHDAGKAELGRHHEEQSAALAAQMARRFGIRGRELRLLTFLVDHHMTLGNYARKNLEEAETIRGFARIVQDEERLNLLMLISAADVRAVAGKNNWSSWRELLVWDLYRRTVRMLAGEEEFLRAEEEERAGRAQQVMVELSGEFAEDEIRQHILGMGAGYLRQCPAALVAAHVRAVHRFFAARVAGADALVPLMEWQDRVEEGHTELTVVTWNREKLFSKIAGSIAVSGLNILSADIFTRDDDVVVDTFRVCNERMEPVSHRVDRATLEKTLTESLSESEDRLAEKLAGQGPTLWQKALGEAEFPATLRIDTESEPGRTLVQVESPDRLGLLYEITKALSEEGMQIVAARITTEKGAALDTFQVVDRQGRAVTEEQEHARLLARLKQVVGR